MRRAMGWTAALMLSVLVAACAGPNRWSKDGAPPEQTSADYSQCRAEAQHDIQRDVNIDTDIAAGRQRDWDRSQTSEVHQSGNISSNERLSHEILKSCMEGKGYAPSGHEPNDGPNWFTMLDM